MHVLEKLLTWLPEKMRNDRVIKLVCFPSSFVFPSHELKIEYNIKRKYKVNYETLPNIFKMLQ